MSDQLDMFEPGAVARRTDPWTSHAAAASVEHIRESQKLIFNILKAHGPKTDQEIFVALMRSGVSISGSGARTRRSELVDLGLVIDSGETQRTLAGRRTIVWKVR